MLAFPVCSIINCLAAATASSDECTGGSHWGFKDINNKASSSNSSSLLGGLGPQLFIKTLVVSWEMETEWGTSPLSFSTCQNRRRKKEKEESGGAWRHPDRQQVSLWKPLDHLKPCNTLYDWCVTRSCKMCKRRVAEPQHNYRVFGWVTSLEETVNYWICKSLTLCSALMKWLWKHRNIQFVVL